MKKTLMYLTMFSTVISLIATSTANTASYWFLYQHKTPKCLK